jgi:hypothetical protein
MATYICIIKYEYEIKWLHTLIVLIAEVSPTLFTSSDSCSPSSPI